MPVSKRKDFKLGHYRRYPDDGLRLDLLQNGIHLLPELNRMIPK